MKSRNPVLGSSEEFQEYLRGCSIAVTSTSISRDNVNTCSYKISNNSQNKFSESNVSSARGKRQGGVPFNSKRVSDNVNNNRLYEEDRRFCSPVSHSWTRYVSTRDYSPSPANPLVQKLKDSSNGGIAINNQYVPSDNDVPSFNGICEDNMEESMQSKILNSNLRNIHICHKQTQNYETSATRLSSSRPLKYYFTKWKSEATIRKETAIVHHYDLQSLINQSKQCHLFLSWKNLYTSSRFRKKFLLLSGFRRIQQYLKMWNDSRALANVAESYNRKCSLSYSMKYLKDLILIKRKNETLLKIAKVVHDRNASRLKKLTWGRWHRYLVVSMNEKKLEVESRTRKLKINAFVQRLMSTNIVVKEDGSDSENKSTSSQSHPSSSSTRQSTPNTRRPRSPAPTSSRTSTKQAIPSTLRNGKYLLASKLGDSLISSANRVSTPRRLSVERSIDSKTSTTAMTSSSGMPNMKSASSKSDANPRAGVNDLKMGNDTCLKSSSSSSSKVSTDQGIISNVVRRSSQHDRMTTSRTRPKISNRIQKSTQDDDKWKSVVIPTTGNGAPAHVHNPVITRARSLSTPRSDISSKSNPSTSITDFNARAQERREKIASLQKISQENHQKRQEEQKQQLRLKEEKENEELQKLRELRRIEMEQKKNQSIFNHAKKLEFSNLLAKAHSFHRKNLLINCGLVPWIQLMEMRRMDWQKACNHWRDSTKNIFFGYWKTYIDCIRRERYRWLLRHNAKADHFNRTRLIRMAFWYWKKLKKILRAKCILIYKKCTTLSIRRRCWNAWKVAFERRQRQEAYLQQQMTERGRKVVLRDLWHRWRDFIHDARLDREVAYRSAITWSKVQSWLQEKS